VRETKKKSEREVTQMCSGGKCWNICVKECVCERDRVRGRAHICIQIVNTAVHFCKKKKLR